MNGDEQRAQRSRIDLVDKRLADVEIVLAALDKKVAEFAEEVEKSLNSEEQDRLAEVKQLRQEREVRLAERCQWLAEHAWTLQRRLARLEAGRDCSWWRRLLWLCAGWVPAEEGWPPAPCPICGARPSEAACHGEP